MIQPSGRTPLIKAARDGHANIARMLPKSIPPEHVKLVDGDENTAIISVARFGHHEIVHILNQAGSPIDAMNLSGNTASMQAARYGNIDCAVVLIVA